MPAVRTVAVAWLLTLAPALAVAQASAPAGHHMPQGTRAAPASAPAAGQVGQSGHAGHHAH